MTTLAPPPKFRPVFCQNPVCREKRKGAAKRLGVQVTPETRGVIQVHCPDCKTVQTLVLE